jgi:hypothetical protein
MLGGDRLGDVTFNIAPSRQLVIRRCAAAPLL